MNPFSSGVQVAGDWEYRHAQRFLQALLVQNTLKRDPHGGHPFVFRGWRPTW